MTAEAASSPGSNLRTTLILAVFWLALTCVRFLFYHEINDRLWIGSFLLDGVLFGLALIVVIKGILAAGQARRRMGNLAIVGIIAGMTALLWATPTGRLTATYFRLWHRESAYQAIVDQLSSDPSGEVPRDTRVDPGPPLRVAFSWGGVIDNWHGIVHDPSGEVLKASRFKADWSNWGDPELRDVKSLFGGDMRSARHLWGHWYYCTFT